MKWKVWNDIPCCDVKKGKNLFYIYFRSFARREPTEDGKSLIKNVLKWFISHAGTLLTPYSIL